MGTTTEHSSKVFERRARAAAEAKETQGEATTADEPAPDTARGAGEEPAAAALPTPTPTPEKTKRRSPLRDADVARLYRQLEAAMVRAVESAAAAGPQPRRLELQVRKSFAREHDLSDEQVRSILARGRALLARAAVAVAAVDATAPVTAPETPAARETRRALDALALHALERMTVATTELAAAIAELRALAGVA